MKLKLPLNCTIKIVPAFKVTINGKEYPATFAVKAEWNGMIELENPGQSSDSIIIHDPKLSSNKYDYIPKMLGGNLPNGEAVEFEAEVVQLGHNLYNLLPKEQR